MGTNTTAVRHEPTGLTASEMSAILGCSLKMAYFYLRNQYPIPPDAAKRLEDATGVSRLHLLYPDEFDRRGYRYRPAPLHHVAPATHAG